MPVCSGIRQIQIKIHASNFLQVCKYKPESIEACKRTLGRMMLVYNIATWMLTFVSVVFLAYALDFI